MVFLCLVGVLSLAMLVSAIVGRGQLPASDNSPVYDGQTDALASSEETHTFAVDTLRITLPDGFREEVVDGYTACYYKDGTMVFILKEDFSLAEGGADMTLDEYAALVHSNNAQRNPTPVTLLDGIPSFRYEFAGEPPVGYLATMFRSDTAFWLVQFACTAETYDAQAAQFAEWAKSVSFAE